MTALWIAIGVMVLALLVTILYLYFRVRRAARKLGIHHVAQRIKDQQVHLENTPKSVAAMTNIYLPQIAEDFPAFDWPDIQQQAQNHLMDALGAITAESYTDTVGDSWDGLVQSRIDNNRQSGCREHFEQVQIYRTEIAAYDRCPGKCVITLQMAVGCLHYIEQGGHVLSGSDTQREQTRYAVQLAYIQDADKLPQNQTALGVHCPNCGAPVTSLGEKYCSYCGAGLLEINRTSWIFTTFYQERAQL